MLQLSRRDFLLSAGGTFANVPCPAFAAARDPRLVVVILRGALDGLAAVPPVGDAAYPAVRGDLAMEAESALPLDGFFELNRAMPELHSRFRIGEAPDPSCGSNALSRPLALRGPGSAGERHVRHLRVPAG